MVLDMAMFAPPHPRIQKQKSMHTTTSPITKASREKPQMKYHAPVHPVHTSTPPPPATFQTPIHTPITNDGAEAPTPNPPHRHQPPITNHHQSSIINHQLTPTHHAIQKKPKEAERKSRKKRKGKKSHKKNLPATHYPLPSQNARAQRKYIHHNLGRIMRISQQTLQRLGIPHVRSSRRHVRATVRFRLHPNGAISGLHLSRRSGLKAIDRRTLQVIRAAHRRYPRPRVPVQVQITMRYGL